MLNWLTRYTPAALAALHDAGSILDVGCGPHGLACIAPDVPFVGADVAFDGEPAASMVAVVLQDAPELPFPDDAFDTVLCLDVLEHVPPAERAPFVRELARVAARGRFIAPLDHDDEFTATHIADLDRVVLLHTAERTSIQTRVDEDTMRSGTARSAADLAPDVLGTDAAWCLDVEFATADVVA